jgi:hypothetical protein
MAMPLGPLRPELQQPLIGRRGFAVTPAITEYPTANIRYFLAFGRQLERYARAVDGLLATAAVQQGFTQSAVAIGNFVLGNVALCEIVAEGVERVDTNGIRQSNGRNRLTNFGKVVHWRWISRRSEC